MNLKKQQLIAISLAFCCAAVMPLQAEARKKENKTNETQPVVSSVPQPRSQKQVLIQNTPTESRRITTPNQSKVQVRTIAAAPQLTAKEAKKAAKEKEKEAFKKEMQDKYNKLPEAQKEAYKKASEAGLKATVNACNDYIERVEEAILRDKLGELPEAISFSYIAKKYFGKSRNWLYQRINGNIVNGKKARFTDNELKTFLNALNDVSEMIHQTSLKIS